jgi:putative colanic acid biosynthesis glycosyltransferase
MENKDTPQFSIVTITLNDINGLRDTRASVEEQSLKDFEWLVIDGMSSDGTVAELEACELPNFSFVSEKDSGLFNAMNKGLMRSRGQYVIFMNSADCLAGPGVLESVRQRVLETGESPAIVYGDAMEKTADSQLLLKKARAIEWLNYGMHTHHQAIFYLKDALADICFDESLIVAADYDLTCRVYRKGGGSLSIDLPICIFSRGGQSQTMAQLGRRDNWRVQRDVLGHTLSRRIFTRLAYLTSFVARTKLPSVYDRLRFQHDHSSS